MSKPILVPLNLNGNQLKNARLDVRSGAPQGAQPGAVWFDPTTGKLNFLDSNSAGVDPTDRAQHHGTQTAATIRDLEVVVKAYPLNTIATPTADVSLAGHKLTDVVTGSSPTDAVNVQQLVDLHVPALRQDVQHLQLAAAGLLPIAAAVATSNVTLHGNPPLLDGYQTQVGDWILLTGQSTDSENGLWRITPPSLSGDAYYWSQADDNGVTYSIVPGAIVQVAKGTQYGGTLWIVSAGTSTAGYKIAGGTLVAFSSTQSNPFQQGQHVVLNGHTFRIGFIQPNGGQYNLAIFADESEGDTVDPSFHPGNGSVTFSVTELAPSAYSASGSLVYGGITVNDVPGATTAGGWKIVTADRALHTGTQSVGTLSDLDQVSLDFFVPPTTDLSLSGHKLTDVAAPSAGTDAVNLGTLNTALANNSTADRQYTDAHLATQSTADRAYTDTQVASVGNRSLSDFAAPTGDLSIGAHKLTNVAAPTAGTDAVNLDFLNSVTGNASARTLDQVPAPVAAVSFNSQRLTNLAPSSSPTDAVNRGELDAVVNGTDWKESVLIKDEGANVPLNGLPTLYGVQVTENARVLLTSQNNPAENAIWRAHAGAWERTPDASQGTLTAAAAVMIEQGPDDVKGTQWRLDNTGPITVGTTPLVWIKFGASAVYTGSRGVNKVGLDFQLDANVPRKFEQLVGDGNSLSLSVVHNLGTRAVTVSVFYEDDGSDVECDIQRTGVNTVQLGFTTPPDVNSLHFVAVG